MSRIELIYDRDCPNISLARERLEAALLAAGIEGRWTEWERRDPKAPAHAANFGSPTILIDGVDVGGEDRSVDASSCRVFPQEDGSLGGVPPQRHITAALLRLMPARMGGMASAGAAATGAGAALTTGVAAACCAGPAVAPLTVALFGASGAAWAASLRPYAIHMLVISAALVGASAWLVFRPVPIGQGLTCRRRPSRSVRAALGLAVVVWCGAVFANFFLNR